MDHKYADIIKLLLRFAIAGLFIWFGMQAVVDPSEPRAWLADWLYDAPIIGSDWFLQLFGVVEVLVGVALVAGFYVRYAALLAGVLLLGIVVNLGVNQTALRDIAIALSSFWLATTKNHAYCVFPKR